MATVQKLICVVLGVFYFILFFFLTLHPSTLYEASHNLLAYLSP